jgi:hypothetical protein
MRPGELTAHQQARARFTLAAVKAGGTCDRQTWREAMLLARDPRVREAFKLAPDVGARIHVTEHRAGRSHRVRRTGGGSRGDPSRSDEPDPPVARCGHCGAAFTPKRSDAKFCPGGACKQASHRRRQRLADVVWQLRADGEIDGVEALILLIAPPADVLARLEAAA